MFPPRMENKSSRHKRYHQNTGPVLCAFPVEINPKQTEWFFFGGRKSKKEKKKTYVKSEELRYLLLNKAKSSRRYFT